MVKMRLLVLVSAVLLASCQSGRDPDTDRIFDVTDVPVNDESIDLSEELIGDIIYSFSSIVEIPAMIKDLGIPYSNGFLVSTDNISGYDDNLKRAFIMGVLGVDLGYMNMYNQTNALPVYMGALRQLTDSLVIGHLFDFAGMEQLAELQSDPGSLMYNYMQSYNRTEQYLREKRRTYLNTALVSGIWLEGLYLLTRAAESHPDEVIFKRIGEQKIILNDLIISLRNHKRSHPEFAQLIEKLLILKEEFDKVEIIYEVDAPQAIEQDGMLVIIQNQRSTVNIAKEQVQKITTKTVIIRDYLIL